MAAGDQSIAGAVPVLLMPFDERDEFDAESMRSQVDFCVEAGSDVLAFGWGTESHLMTDAELVEAWSVVVEHADGRVPVVAATTHPSDVGTKALTQMARDCGVDAAMVNPDRRRGSDVVDLFKSLSDDVGLPIVVQDAAGNTPVDDLIEAVIAAEYITALKIECPATPHKMGVVCERLDALADRNVTVLGGSNGSLLIEELDRGSVGTMPHPAIIDAFKDVCDLHLQGERDDAWTAYCRLILPIARLVQSGGAKGGSLWLHKHLFAQAGIFQTDRCRADTSIPPDWVMEQVIALVRSSGTQVAGLID